MRQNAKLTKLQHVPRWAWIAGAAALVVVGAGVYVAVEGVPAWAGRPTLAEAAERAKERPDDARAQRTLGHARFAEGKRAAGLVAYERALTLDPEAHDDELLANLVACYGTKVQGDAASLIVRKKLVAIEPRLDDLARSDRYNVRWGALQTLEKLGRASRADFVNAWMKDLESEECDVRRAAVENLGKEGDKRALKALRAARTRDEAKRGWFGATCLGGRVDDAEKRIVAAR